MHCDVRVIAARVVPVLTLAFILIVVAFINPSQIMGWGHKAIEIRAAETGHLDGVFMHKKAQKLKFLCERNDKVSSTITFIIFVRLWHFRC